MGRIIGIDLGTAKSCVAVMENGVPRVIPNQEGEPITPSIVGFTDSGSRLVGRIALLRPARMPARPENVVTSLKLIMGRKIDDREAIEARGVLPFKMVAGANRDLHIKIDDEAYFPPQISSFLLQKLKAAAEDCLGTCVDEAVISVPACFSESQRKATRDAGFIAGFKEVSLVDEPTAAALAYGLQNAADESRVVAVYDLGGGTFDVAILQLEKGLCQVRATTGDAFLGGEDFNQRIVDWLIQKVNEETGIDLRQNATELWRAREAVENAKRKLSQAKETKIALSLPSADTSGRSSFSTVLTRQRYEELTADLVERTIEMCQHCLADAGLKPEQIDEVLLMGGQARAPKVKELVERVFSRKPSCAVDTDEGVALGAAVHAMTLRGELEDLVLQEVTSHTLGIETADGTFTPLIRHSSPIPTSKSRVFTTAADNQTRVEVHLLQGESDMAAYNKSLAKLVLTDIPPAPRGVPQIEVSFEIDVNGIISVAARDQTTGRSQSMAICLPDDLSPSAVTRLIVETHAREGRKLATEVGPSRLESLSRVLQLIRGVERTVRTFARRMRMS